MTREEKQKAIDALKISAPVMAVTQEEFNNYIQTLNQIVNLLEQQPCGDTRMIDKSNFSMEQYKTDIQSAYDCGKASVAPCEDTISRQETVERLCKVADFMNEKRSGLDSPYIMAALFIQDNKDEFPPVTPQPKMGHWIGHREHCENLGVMPSGLGAYEWCSNCDCGIDVREWHRNHYNFCPNCGAKMQEVVE